MTQNNLNLDAKYITTHGGPDTFDARSQSQKDRDKVLYSVEFRRLAGVTQVASATEQLLLHNRNTHSLKVEQVGTSLVTFMSPKLENNPDANQLNWRVAVGCLAHDIGHPPFGHIGEEAIHEWLTCDKHRRGDTNPVKRGIAKNYITNSSSTLSAESSSEQSGALYEPPCQECKLEDGFEGNAQSFRIVSKLAVWKEWMSPQGHSSYGFNFSRGSLRALSKYPWVRGANSEKLEKWGAYDADLPMLKWVFEEHEDFSRPAKKDLAAEIMDWADDITYAVHDLDDFYRIGLVPLDQIAQGVKELSGKNSGAEFKGEAGNFRDYAIQHVQKSLNRSLSGPDAARRTLDSEFARFATTFPGTPFKDDEITSTAIIQSVSDLISYFISGAKFNAHDGFKVAESQQHVNELLKQFTWYYVIDNPALGTIQAGQRKVLSNVLDDLYELASHAFLNNKNMSAERDKRRLPPRLRSYVQRSILELDEFDWTGGRKEKAICRSVVDYVASLTDAGAYRLHARLRGDAGISILEPSVS